MIVPSIAKSVLKGGSDLGWRKKSLHFRCSGNHMDAMENYRLDSFHIETENAFDDTTTLGFPTDNSNNWVDGNQVVFLGGRDQTIGQLVSGINCVYADPARPAATGFCVYSGATKTDDAASTLTLKACRDASCYIQLMGNLSLVYDPVGDFTQTFSNRAHTLSGPIVVKGGTLRFSGASTLKNVTSVKVQGSSRLAFDGCAENPFTAANMTLEIDETARLELSEGSEISVRNLIIGGERVKVAEYTSGTLPQIVGGGKIVVTSESGVSYWMGTKNNAWGEAENWDNGVPSKSAFFDRPGAWRVDTTGVSLPSALSLDMTNPSADTTTVVVAESVAFNGAKFSLGRNSVLEIADTANVTFSNSKVEIAEDGSAVLAGGTTTFETGTPTLKGGSLCATGASTLVLAATGGTTPFATGYTYFGGDSELRNASTKNYNLWYFTPNAAGEICRVEFADRAYFNGRPGNVVDSFVLNNGRSGAQTFFTMRDHAHGELCLALQIAKGNGTYAEMAMADSAYAHVLYYGVNIATGGTDVNNPAKGVLKMTGGALDVQSQKADAASSRYGIVVGDGSGAEADGYANVGEVQLTGGVITNRLNGAVTIGVGSGKGLVRQTGGEFQSRNYYPIVLGLRGGFGCYELEGGTFFANGDVYVGGCPTGTVGSAYVNLPADKVGQGTLSVSGGVFTARNLYVSQEGQGSMVVGGGSISVNNLTLGSSTDSATGHSCVSSLTFSLGDDGAHGLISVKNTLTLADNVQLVVDFGDYKGKFVKLLTANAVTGGFVPENITFRGTYKDRGQILFREGVLWAGVQQGLAISFR
ncbi:MAG: hypothetical protein MJ240_13495 [Kiritimatiellae bacterium]|nr:hypothetical protein [Kiritimatiellia bacterium]